MFVPSIGKVTIAVLLRNLVVCSYSSYRSHSKALANIAENVAACPE